MGFNKFAAGNSGPLIDGWIPSIRLKASHTAEIGANGGRGGDLGGCAGGGRGGRIKLTGETLKVSPGSVTARTLTSVEFERTSSTEEVLESPTC